MSDIIKLLPDAIANQIAAGEVIQRPASIVKELLENAVDAGATQVNLLFKDAGRTLVQVIDNGKGMSETDARLCWERHATSKISSAEDLFKLNTFGFRGEALASIAAVAQVELKTKRKEDKLGVRIQIEGSVIKKQEPVAALDGTSIAVRNLFFNTPARRNFLKSNPVETRHILDEWTRVILPNPGVAFSLFNNDVPVQELTAGTQQKRIQDVLQVKESNLMYGEESAPGVSINAWVLQPELFKKTRGEQFFFVNGRFIKDPYLHHAVVNAFEQILPKDTHPAYVIFIEMDPGRIDVNVHPTKTEIKFDDERMVYAFVRSIVKKAIGKTLLIPEEDSEQSYSPFRELQHNPIDPLKFPTPPQIKTNPSYNPFKPEQLAQKRKEFDNWGKFQELMPRNDTGQKLQMDFPEKEQAPSRPLTGELREQISAVPLHQRFIMASIKSGLLLVDRQGAHERVLYEDYLRAYEQHKAPVQQLLFPRNLSFSNTQVKLLEELLPEIRALGFDIEPFGGQNYLVNGIPADMPQADPMDLLEGLLAGFMLNQQQLQLEVRENLARSLAKQAAVKATQQMSPTEASALIDQLFACQQPHFAPDGRRIILTLTLDEISTLFQNK